MGVALRKRNRVVVTSALFVVLTLLFTVTIAALHRNGSVVEWKEAVLFFNRHWGLAPSALIASTAIIRASHYSRLLYSIHIILIISVIAPLLIDSFDKLTMFISFLFLIISYFYYLLLSDELADAIYNPKYKKSDLDIVTSRHLSATIIDKNGLEYPGILTNWSSTSCFIRLDSPQAKPKRAVKLKVNFQGATFVDCGNIVSRYYSGVGMRLLATKQTEDNDNLKWPELYQTLTAGGLITSYPVESVED